MARDDEKKTTIEAPKRGTRTKSTSPRTATTRTPRRAKDPLGGRTRTAGGFTDPNHEEIARRAYAIWQETGNPDPQENWRRAERELKERP